MEATLTKPAKNTMKHKACVAATKFLEHAGYEILNEGISDIIDIVAFDNDNNCLVFVNVNYSKKSEQFERCTVSREEFESNAIEYLKAHSDMRDVSVRFDNISLNILSDDYAFIRHYQSVMNSVMDNEEELVCR